VEVRVSALSRRTARSSENNCDQFVAASVFDCTTASHFMLPLSSC
jgi:hypothetical protein